MLRKLYLLAFVLLAAPASAQDMFPVHECVIYASPDVRQWPATVTITGITLGPGHDAGGLSFQAQGLERWPNYEPPGWAGGGEGLLYTVWGARAINGQWHCAGVIQMWRSRQWTGAPLPDEYGSWFYDANRWGPLAQFPIRAGEQFCAFLTAGNARKGSAGAEPDVTSRAERSNSVCWNVPAVSQGQLTFASVPVPPTAPIPTPPSSPTPPQTPAQPVSDAFLTWSLGFERWAREYADWTKQQNEYQTTLLRNIDAQNERIFADLSRQIAAAAKEAPSEPVRVDSNNVKGWVSLIMAIAGAVGGGIAAAK